MKLLIPLVLCVLTLFTNNVTPARILGVALIPSYSHQMFYQPLWKELALRGHEVVVITTDPTNEELPNFKEINIKESYVPMKEFMNLMINTSMVKIILQNKWIDVNLQITEFQLQLPQVQELINNKTEHFDLIMIEHFISPAFGLQYHFNCPMIGIMSLDAMVNSHEIMGNPDHHILYPASLFPVAGPMSFFQRLTTVFFGSLVNYMQLANEGKLTDSGRKIFGKDMPPIGELFEKTDMLFVNANPLFSAVRPHTPSTISIAGGMHIRPEKPLPKNLKDFLDNATKGAVYFSLGSNVKSNELTTELRQIIMDTLAELPYQVLWKYEEDTLPGKPDNVMITKWAPQQDVLRHKNIKLFITQGGLQSLEEALYSHIPMVVMPFFGDQEANAGRVKHEGLGVIVDRHNLKKEEFKAAIFEVIDNPVYRETIKQFATQIQDTPMTPLERAVWWTEYVLRHNGSQHLKGPRIPFYQYYYLDVLTVLGAVIFIILGVLFGIGKLCVKGISCMVKCVKKTETKDKLKKN